MVCLLDAHRDRVQNIRYETPFETTPAIATETYLDTFGNHVRRFIAPAGDLTIRRDAIIEDSGQPDPVKLDAEEIAVERLPNDTLVFTLGSRYCETDKLSDIAWQLFGSAPRGWRRVQAICDFVCGSRTATSSPQGNESPHEKPVRTCGQRGDAQRVRAHDLTLPDLTWGGEKSGQATSLPALVPNDCFSIRHPRGRAGHHRGT